MHNGSNDAPAPPRSGMPAVKKYGVDKRILSLSVIAESVFILRGDIFVWLFQTLDKSRGHPEEEARAHIAVVQEATDELVTKADMRGMMAELKADLSLLLVKVVVGALVALTAIFSFVVSIVLAG